MDDPDLLPVPPDGYYDDDGDDNREDGWSRPGLYGGKDDNDDGMLLGSSQTDPLVLSGNQAAPAAERIAGSQSGGSDVPSALASWSDATEDGEAAHETGADADEVAAGAGSSGSLDGDVSGDGGGDGCASSSAPSKGGPGMHRVRAAVDADGTTLPNSVIRSYIADRSSLIRLRDDDDGGYESPSMAQRHTAPHHANTTSATTRRRRRFLLDIASEELLSAAASGQLLPELCADPGHISTSALSRSLHLLSLLPRGSHAELVSLHAFVLRGGPQGEVSSPEAQQQQQQQRQEQQNQHQQHEQQQPSFVSDEDVGVQVHPEGSRAQGDGRAMGSSAAEPAGTEPQNGVPGGGESRGGAAAAVQPEGAAAASPLPPPFGDTAMDVDELDPYQHDPYLDVFHESRRDGDEDGIEDATADGHAEGEPSTHVVVVGGGSEVGFTHRTKLLIRQLEKIFRQDAAQGGADGIKVSDITSCHLMRHRPSLCLCAEEAPTGRSCS